MQRVLLLLRVGSHDLSQLILALGVAPHNVQLLEHVLIVHLRVGAEHEEGLLANLDAFLAKTAHHCIVRSYFLLSSPVLTK